MYQRIVILKYKDTEIRISVSCMPYTSDAEVIQRALKAFNENMEIRIL